MMWIGLAMILGGLLIAFAVYVEAMLDTTYAYGSHVFWGSLGVAGIGLVVALTGFLQLAMSC